MVTITTFVVMIKAMAKNMGIITKVMVTIIKIPAKIMVRVIGVIKVGEIFKMMFKEIPHPNLLQRLKAKVMISMLNYLQLNRLENFMMDQSKMLNEFT